MKASELIKEISKLMDKYGDKDVFMYIATRSECNPDSEAMSEVDGVSLESCRIEKSKYFELYGVE